MIVLLLIAPLISSRSVFIYLNASALGVLMFIKVISSCCIDPLGIMKWPFLSLVMFFTLRSILLDISISNPAFFHFHFRKRYFFIPSLSVCVSPLLWGGSFVDSIYMGHVFFIHSANESLLIGAFGPFIFKVTIERYLFVAIFMFCVPYYLSISSFYTSPFSISCIASLVLINTFSLFLSFFLSTCEALYFPFNFEW